MKFKQALYTEGHKLVCSSVDLWDNLSSPNDINLKRIFTQSLDGKGVLRIFQFQDILRAWKHILKQSILRLNWSRELISHIIFDWL